MSERSERINGTVLFVAAKRRVTHWRRIPAAAAMALGDARARQ
jgi:hypothetical protein